MYNYEISINGEQLPSGYFTKDWKKTVVINNEMNLKLKLFGLSREPDF